MAKITLKPPPANDNPPPVEVQDRWEVVCPDDAVRVDSFLTLGTAAMACAFHSRPLGYHPSPKVQPNLTPTSVSTRAAENHRHDGCPGGKHTVRRFVTR